jgi:protoheme IX farnesyltransferase
MPGRFVSAATERTAAVLPGAPIVVRTGVAGIFAAAMDYWALTKPEVNFLVLITAFAGFRLASSTASPATAVQMLLGTLLVASGAAALNQFLERSFDRQMRRTSRRPLAAGKLRPADALWFGISLSALGVLCLTAINFLSAALSLATLLSYLFLYTPLKRMTPLCTLVGAFPGAAPPLIGWAAARGRLDPEAWVLYFIIFLWQFPHFMSIVWMYREDYSRAGYRVLPLPRSQARFVIWQSFGFSLALIPVAVLPSAIGESDAFYAAGATLLSLALLYSSGRFVFRRSNLTARQLLVASILYLPLLFAILLIGKK